MTNLIKNRASANEKMRKDEGGSSEDRVYVMEWTMRNALRAWLVGRSSFDATRWMTTVVVTPKRRGEGVERAAKKCEPERKNVQRMGSRLVSFIYKIEPT